VTTSPAIRGTGPASPGARQPSGLVLIVALTRVSARQSIANAHFLQEHGVPVAILTAEPIALHDYDIDPSVPVIDLTRAEVATLPHRATVHLRRLRTLGLPGRAVNAVGHKVYKVLRPAVLWRAAEHALAEHLDLDNVSEIILADAHAVPLGWHLARSRPDLSVVFSLDRSRYLPVGDTAPESADI